MVRLPITFALEETHCLVRLDGELGLSSAAELKSRLMEGLAAGREMVFELEHVTGLDITILQLLWVAGREASQAGMRVTTRMSAAAVSAACEAGFPAFPNLTQA